MWYLKLLGGASIDGGEGAPGGEPVRRHPLAFLALLAMAPSATLTRDQAIGLLWPELFLEQAFREGLYHTWITHHRLGLSALAGYPPYDRLMRPKG